MQELLANAKTSLSSQLQASASCRCDFRERPRSAGSPREQMKPSHKKGCFCTATFGWRCTSRRWMMCTKISPNSSDSLKGVPFGRAQHWERHSSTSWDAESWTHPTYCAVRWFGASGRAASAAGNFDESEEIELRSRESVEVSRMRQTFRNAVRIGSIRYNLGYN